MERTITITLKIETEEYDENLEEPGPEQVLLLVNEMIAGDADFPNGMVIECEGVKLLRR